MDQHVAAFRVDVVGNHEAGGHGFSTGVQRLNQLSGLRTGSSAEIQHLCSEHVRVSVNGSIMIKGEEDSKVEKEGNMVSTLW